MPNHIQAEREHRNQRPTFEATDNYSVHNTVTQQDVNADGVKDLIVSHVVKRNGQLFYTSTNTWYGVDDDTYNLFVQHITPFLDDFETNDFNRVVNNWDKLTKVHGKIIDYGRMVASKIKK